MKRIVIFIAVGLLMFGAGFGGGLIFGRSMAESAGAGGAGGSVVSEPGPIIPVGEFTCNLAGSGRSILNFAVSLETTPDSKAVDIINSIGWHTRIRNEILLIVKDKIYEDLTSAEGALQLSEEIKRSLNAQLPQLKGETLIARVLFDSFILQ